MRSPSTSRPDRRALRFRDVRRPTLLGIGKLHRLTTRRMPCDISDPSPMADVVIGNAALCSVDGATTMRLRHGEMELTEGPFAVTKEILAGYQPG